MPATLDPSALDSAAERLLVDIVSGRYRPGTRLPGERELAQALGASRSTVREALRHLESMGLVEVRRGSGGHVRPARDWTFEVLPAYLAAGAPLSTGGIAALVSDMLILRTELLLVMMRMVAPHLSAGDLDRARVLAVSAWEAREDLGVFAERDLDALREVGDVARSLPALWLLNTLTGVYVQAARLMPGPAQVPPDYLDVYMRTFSALERGDAALACDVLGDFFERHDRSFLDRLGG